MRRQVIQPPPRDVARDKIQTPHVQRLAMVRLHLLVHIRRMVLCQHRVAPTLVLKYNIRPVRTL